MPFEYQTIGKLDNFQLVWYSDGYCSSDHSNTEPFEIQASKSLVFSWSAFKSHCTTIKLRDVTKLVKFLDSVTNIEVFFFVVADAGVLAATLTGHTDAIWGLAFHGPRQQLLSSSSDGTVKLW